MHILCIFCLEGEITRRRIRIRQLCSDYVSILRNTRFSISQSQSFLRSVSQITNSHFGVSHFAKYQRPSYYFDFRMADATVFVKLLKLICI